MTFKLCSFGGVGYVEVQCMMIRLFSPKIFTAFCICSIVLIPVDNIIGLLVDFTFIKSFLLVSIADAILWHDTSNFSRKSMLSSSQAAANQMIFFFLQYSSISLYSSYPNYNARFKFP